MFGKESFIGINLKCSPIKLTKSHKVDYLIWNVAKCAYISVKYMVVVGQIISNTISFGVMWVGFTFYCISVFDYMEVFIHSLVFGKLSDGIFCIKYHAKYHQKHMFKRTHDEQEQNNNKKRYLLILFDLGMT